MKWNNTPTFLFYDYETFGLNTFLDKPAQFACIRTDMDLNIIDDPKCFYCFSSDDYLPDPISVLITKITPQYTKKNGMNEHDFSKKIHDILTCPNTCIVGWNNIPFDDEITRNLFYRNFFDPYEWSWKNGNTRWDLLNVLRACYALRPDGIQWPHDERGLPIFRLSELTKINHIMHSDVHDAISDVYATIEIAKLVKKKQPKLFNFFFEHRIKKKIYALIDIQKIDPVVHVSNSYGAIRKNVSCILPIIRHKNNINIFISIDLLADVEALISIMNTIILDKITAKDLFKFGVKLLYLNRCPILAPIRTISKKNFYRLNFNYELYIKNMNLLKNNDCVFEKIQYCLSKNDFFKESLDVDCQLYDAFFNSHDKILIKKVRKIHISELKDSHFPFHDDRLRKMFFRYRARNFFYTLDDDEKKNWFNYCQRLFHPQYLNQYKSKLESLLIENSHNENKFILLHYLLIDFDKKTKKYSECISN